jgi:hypothetical protein
MKKLLLSIVVILFLGGVSVDSSAAESESGKGEITLTHSQVPVEASVLPGLRVWYQRNCNIRHVRRMPKPEKFKRGGREGDPVAAIDHRFGRGKVFDSGGYNKVCVLFEGLLHFERTGTYSLRMLSNDGVRVFINDQQVLDDPGVHADRWKVSAPIKVAEAGWYPLRIQYFQRKGTAALRLTWQPPDAEDFAVIRPEAYGHLHAP